MQKYDASSHIDTIKMGRKFGDRSAPFKGEGSWVPS